MKNSETSRIRIAIVGSGPTALMTASQLVLSEQASRFELHLFEKRSGFGRKLLIAGSSGLNISHEHSTEDFSAHYEGWSSEFWSELLHSFKPSDWISFIEKKLGLETFLGTSQRYFVREMKASTLLKRWISFLESHGVILHSGHELTDFAHHPSGIHLSFNNSDPLLPPFDRVVLALGGASWEHELPSWFDRLKEKSLQGIPFEPSNVGYEVNWSEAFLKESEGHPIKKVLLTTRKGSKLGELMITRYGLEGTPVYFTGTSGMATLDLKPDLSESEIHSKLGKIRENLSPNRRIQRGLGLCEAAQSLVFHHSPDEVKKDLKSLVSRIKAFPIEFIRPRPLLESISSKGGLSLTEVSSDLELIKYPGIYIGGEMLDWDAPTGGFLIQACVTQGAWIARSILKTTKA